MANTPDARQAEQREAALEAALSISQQAHAAHRDLLIQRGYSALQAAGLLSIRIVPNPYASTPEDQVWALFHFVPPDQTVLFYEPGEEISRVAIPQHFLNPYKALEQVLWCLSETLYPN